MKVRSFSSFKPVCMNLTGTQSRQHMFHMWMRANLHALDKPFDKNTWRVGRPWLNMRELQQSYLYHKSRSIGHTCIGTRQVSDATMRKALQYEALYFGHVNNHVLQQYADAIFKPSEHNTDEKIIKSTINRYRIFEELPPINQQDWARWYDPDKHTHLTPKIKLTTLKNILRSMFKPNKQGNMDNKDILQHIQPMLDNLDADIDEHNPIFKKAAKQTIGQPPYALEKVQLEENVRNIIRKYYKRNPIVTEPLDRLAHVTGISAKHPLWDNIDRHISPRIDWTPEHYDIALENKYALACTNSIQKPFQTYHGNNWRPKQIIPWKRILKDIPTTTQRTSEKTIEHINRRLQQEGLVPYHPKHPIFDHVRVQGYNIKRNTHKKRTIVELLTQHNKKFKSI